MDKKEAIQQAAIQIFAKEGFYNAKMHAIANEAGVAIGTVYLYFSSKEDILNYIFQVDYTNRMAQVCDVQSENLTWLQKIEKYLMINFQELRDRPDTSRVIFQEALDPNLRKLEWVNTMYTELPKVYQYALDKAKENGEIDSELTGSTIFYAGKAMTYMLLVSLGEKADDAVHQMIMLLINGIKSCS